MVKQKKKKVGRPKKEPTRTVRVIKKKPNFEIIASKFSLLVDENSFTGFLSGCNYVWDTYINKRKTKHRMS